MVILLAANVPEVGLHGLFATGGVLLCEERGLVLGDLHQVFLTLLHHRCHRAEAVADVDLLRGKRRGASDGTQAADVEVLTVRVRGGCYAVGSCS